MTVYRAPHGGTSRPELARPGNGYGRPGRAGPARAWNRQALSWRRSSGPERDMARLLASIPPAHPNGELVDS